ncbi:hypothetical protein K3495_g5992 [Podosphaera aphanis]|nr:hypothetical protein K3495_g5992 [Podosphaera aphanis]
MLLFKKGDGKSIMVPNSLYEYHGQLYYTVAGHKKWVREMITPGNGKCNDGWWTCEHMINQLPDSVLPSFEELHPGCTIVFAYYNNMDQKKMPLDGLNDTQLNLSDGGKNARVSCELNHTELCWASAKSFARRLLRG